ncbi:hypothetical protein ACWCSD_24235 [Nonomuraea sp. NPDC001684]
MWVTDLDVDIDRTSVRVANDTGGTDLAMSAATPSQRAYPSGARVSTLTSYTQIGEAWHSTLSQTNMLSAGSSRLPAGQFGGGGFDEFGGAPVGQAGPAGGGVEVAGRQLHPGAAIGEEQRPGASAVPQPGQEPGGGSAPDDDADVDQLGRQVDARRQRRRRRLAGHLWRVALQLQVEFVSLQLVEAQGSLREEAEHADECREDHRVDPFDGHEPDEGPLG